MQVTTPFEDTVGQQSAISNNNSVVPFLKEQKVKKVRTRTLRGTENNCARIAVNNCARTAVPSNRNYS